MNNQIFISYRRENGEALAHLIYERLTHEHYKVFLDVESLLSGKFNEKLYEVIQTCTDFVLILSPNGLDRCSDPGDWVRLEIECALRCRKNIVLVMMRGFSFPEKLPESLKELAHYNGIMANFELFDGTMDKLKRMLHSKAVDDTIPVTCDPDFSGKYKMVYIISRFDGVEDTIGFPLFKQNNHIRVLEDDELNPEGLSGDIMKLYGKRALTPRKAVKEVQINEKKYRIFEVFRYNQKKYAYAVEWNIPYTLQQKGIFFELSDDGSVCPVDSEAGSILVFYCMCIRMLDFIPQCFLKSYKNSSGWIHDY